MVSTPGASLEARLAELPEPSLRLLLGRGLPQFVSDGVVPVLVFYGAWKAFGLAAGIGVSAAVSLAIAAWAMRRGRATGLVVAGAVFVLIQAAVALASHSATVYLAQPVVLSALWGVAYAGSVVVRRPLIAVFASAWYPFPSWFLATRPVRREFSTQSLVWAVYCFARAALRLAALLRSGIGGFIVVSVLTGTPVAAVLVAWSVWHARRVFSRFDVATFAD